MLTACPPDTLTRLIEQLLFVIRRTNVFLLVVRLLSTSMMALLNDQADQVQLIFLYHLPAWSA